MKVSPQRWYNSLIVQPRNVCETCRNVSVASHRSILLGYNMISLRYSPMEVAKIAYTSSVGSCNARFGTLCDASVSSSGMAEEDTLLRRAFFRDMLSSMVTTRGDLGIDEMVVEIKSAGESGKG